MVMFPRLKNLPFRVYIENIEEAFWISVQGVYIGGQVIVGAIRNKTGWSKSPEEQRTGADSEG